MKFNTLAFYSLLAFAIIVSIVAYSKHRRNNTSVAARMEQIVSSGKSPEIPCTEVAASRPLVLLALGQSNAGNHGSPSARAFEPVILFAEGKCIKTTEPLPGATGTGGSIWQRLPSMLSIKNNSRPIVLSVLAVDATSIDDWTNEKSPLNNRLSSHVQSMNRANLAPNLVLWQQGETDAQLGTSKDDYSSGLNRLAAKLDKAGLYAPILIALSTRCQTSSSETIRSAIETTVTSDHRFRLGPDTDTLSGDIHRNGCHLTADGLSSAAKMWATTINAELITSNRFMR